MKTQIVYFRSVHIYFFSNKIKSKLNLIKKIEIKRPQAKMNSLRFWFKNESKLEIIVKKYGWKKKEVSEQQNETGKKKDNNRNWLINNTHLYICFFVAGFFVLVKTLEVSCAFCLVGLPFFTTKFHQILQILFKKYCAWKC